MLDREPIAVPPPPPVPAPPPPPSQGAPAGGAREEQERRALAEVLLLLSRAQSRQRRIRLLSAALLAAAGLAALCPALLALSASGSWLARPLGLAALAAALAGVAWWGLWRSRAEVGSLQATARLLAPRLASPVLRRGLLPAFELGRELELKEEEVGFSPALARAHIDEVARSARAADLARALPDRPVRRSAQAFLFAALLFVLSAVLWRDTLSRGARALLAGTEGPAKQQARAEPITGEIELTYVYPAYTRLPERTVPDTNGEIAAPRGTQVKLKTRSDREVAQAVVVMAGQEQGQAQAALPLSVEGGRSLSGTLLVSEPGSYRFRFLDRRGRPVAEGPPIPIAVEPDEPPRVSIAAPQGDLEVDPRSRVVLRFDADDDFGLSQVALLYRLPGASRPERVVLHKPGDGPRRSSGEYGWDLTAPGLMPGDTIDYYLEATDNDEVSGKKTGVSRTQHLKLFSEAEHHRQIVKQVEAAWEKLVMLLGDRLEGPERKAEGRTPDKVLAQAPVDAKALELASELALLSRALRKQKAPDQLPKALAHVSDALERAAAATSDARNTLAMWARRGVGSDSEPMRRLARAVEAEIAEEEKDVLYLEALLDQQRIADLLSLSRELAARRRDLASALERYRTAADAATREQIEREMARLKERVAELMRRMAELSRQVNDQHLNAEALAEIAKAEGLLSSFDRLQELLHQGKVEEAMKELEKLGQALDRMAQRLEKSAKGRKGGGPFGELGRQLSELAQRLDRLEESQQDLLAQTQKVRESYKDALQQRLREKGADFVQELRRKTGEAREKLGAVGNASNFFFPQDDLRRARDSVEDLDKALAVRDFDQAAQSAAKALSHSRSLSEDLDRQAAQSRSFPPPWRKEAAEAQANARNAREAVPLLKEVSDALQDLFPPPGAAMSEADRQKMRELAQRQGQLRDQADGLKQRMDEINKQAPLFPEEARQMIEQAGERMGRAQQQMQARNPTGASAEERAALDQIGALKRGLAGRGGGEGEADAEGGQGVPWPWMAPGLSPGDEMEGFDGSANAKVEIPGADQYQVPEEYRKDILDAMKQSAPEKYRDQVKRYYEEIVK